MQLEFKKGSQYSRKDIGWICFPDHGRPAGGLYFMEVKY